MAKAKEIKLGMHVRVTSACAALGADGSVDLPEGHRGAVVSLNGSVAGVRTKGGTDVHFVDVSNLAGTRGRPVKIASETAPAETSADEASEPASAE